MVGAKGKLGRIFKTHPKYGDECFEDPTTLYVEQDLVHHQFEAETEQREDKNGTKLPGTRINYETIGPVPNRDKKKRA